MNCLSAVTHKLDWSGAFPGDFGGVRFPGGIVRSARGDFGELCIQEYQGEDYHFFYQFFSFRKTSF
ncbi:hypothetical protein [Flavihumibacter petaseus]|uniref:hypothetical protein n=1 Tax=Flavihumibacter petaseus TaxID=549295 RepID=UPI00061D04F6|nr:hypothetical protein [Flavihumibacter petaseus]